MAAIPPSVASAPGSTGNIRPCSAAARSSAVRVTPACTVAVRSSGEISTHAVHPGEVEGDAALDRDDVALEAGAGAERRHGHAALVGEREDGRDLLRGLRVDDDVGPMRAVEGHVARVQVALRVAVRHAPLVAERVDERRAQVSRAHAGSLSDGSSGPTRSTAQRMLSWTARSAAAGSRDSQACRKAA